MHRNCICGADCDWNRFMALPGCEGRWRARLNLREPRASTECTLEPSRVYVCGRDVKYCFIAPRHTKHLSVLVQLITIKKWSRATVKLRKWDTGVAEAFCFQTTWNRAASLVLFSVCVCVSLSPFLRWIESGGFAPVGLWCARLDLNIHTYIILRLITKCEMPPGAHRIEENMVFY
jgi:hypothetical protein